MQLETSASQMVKVHSGKDFMEESRRFTSSCTEKQYQQEARVGKARTTTTAKSDDQKMHKDRLIQLHKIIKKG